MAKSFITTAGDVLLLSIALVIGLSPIWPWTGSAGPHNIERLLQLLILLPLSFALYHPKGNDSTHRRPALGWSLLFFLGSLSVLSSARPEIALREWLLMLSMAGCIVVLGRRRDLAARFQLELWLLPVLVGGAALYAALELLLLVLGLSQEGTLDHWHLFAGYTNPRFFNHVQTLSMPVLAGLLGMPQLRGLWRGLAWFALGANACFLVLLMGRATLAGLLIGAIFALGFFSIQGRMLVRRLVLAFIWGGLAYLLLTKGLPKLLDMSSVAAFRAPGDRGSVEARLYLWDIALKHISQHPWLGIGPMHYAHQYNGEAAHPHNIYLQVAAEYGLPFAILLATLIARWLFRNTIRLRAMLFEHPDQLALGCHIAIVAALVDGLFSGNFVMPLPQLWIVLAAGLLKSRLSPERQFSNSPVPVQPSPMEKAGWILVMLAQIYLLATAMPEFLNPPIRIEGSLSVPADAPNYYPRFWLDGWF